MQRRDFKLVATDGTQLQAYRWDPDGPVRAAVQIIHGMTEHARRYDRFAQALSAAGYAVVALDLRGHGQSAASEDDLGFFNDQDGWRTVLEDLGVQRRWIVDEHPGKPLVLFGHSMGSFLAQQIMQDHGGDYRGVVLCGSNGPAGPLRAVAALIARLEMLRLGPRARSGLLRKMSAGTFNKPFLPARTEFDWLSRDDDEVDKYIADPLCGFEFTTSAWRDLLTGLGVLHRPSGLARTHRALPVYVIAGTADPVSNQTKGLETLIAAYRKAGLKAVEHKFYDGARHELLNEINRDQVTADILTWLENLVPTG